MKENSSVNIEKFIKEYCKKKGWNPNNLSPSQLIQIVEDKEYKKR
jgi:hypothetical protein